MVSRSSNLYFSMGSLAFNSTPPWRKRVSSLCNPMRWAAAAINTCARTPSFGTVICTPRSAPSMTFRRTLPLGTVAACSAASHRSFVASSSANLFERSWSCCFSFASLAKLILLALASFLAALSAWILASLLRSKVSHLAALSARRFALAWALSRAAAERASCRACDAARAAARLFIFSCFLCQALCCLTSSSCSASFSALLAAALRSLAFAAACAAFRADDHFLCWAASASCASAAAACFCSAGAAAVASATAAAAGAGAATGAAAAPSCAFLSRLSSAPALVPRWRTAETPSGTRACSSRKARPRRARVMA
mmetsp:Transcript_25071/g.78705  ORF Transcript_25071/g.78705 Transcript_25071/m.78705 type:complete len:313 (-) Transcript_25071:36-974(-)